MCLRPRHLNFGSGRHALGRDVCLFAAVSKFRVVVSNKMESIAEIVQNEGVHLNFAFVPIFPPPRIRPAQAMRIPPLLGMERASWPQVFPL